MQQRSTKQAPARTPGAKPNGEAVHIAHALDPIIAALPRAYGMQAYFERGPKQDAATVERMRQQQRLNLNRGA